MDTGTARVGDALIRNTFWYALVTVLGLASGLLMSILLARALGPARMGDFSYLVWAGRMMEYLATLGFAIATVRYTAAARARGELSLASGFVRFFVTRQLISTAIVITVLSPIVVAFSPDSLRWPFVVALLSLVPVTLETIYTNAVYGAQRYDITAQTSALKMGLHLALSAVALWLGGGVLGVVVAVLVGTTVSCAVQEWRTRGLYTAPPAPVEAGPGSEVRRYVIVASACAILESLVWERSEVFFLRLSQPLESIAFYSLAFGLATRAMLLPTIFVKPLLPAFAALHGQAARAEYVAVYRRALRYVALVGMPLAAVAAPLAPAAVTFLYGAPFLPAAHIFQALALVAVLDAMRGVAWVAMTGTGDRRYVIQAMVVAALMDIGMAAVLIRPYGTTGAVIANASAQVVAAGWVFAAMARTREAAFPAAGVARIAAAAAVAWSVTAWLAPAAFAPGPMMAAATAGLVSFAAAGFAFGVVSGREWDLARRRLGGVLLGRPPGDHGRGPSASREENFSDSLAAKRPAGTTLANLEDGDGRAHPRREGQ